MQDYRWVWTVIVLLIICYALVSLMQVYWREWRERRRTRRAEGDAAGETSPTDQPGSGHSG